MLYEVEKNSSQAAFCDFVTSLSFSQHTLRRPREPYGARKERSYEDDGGRYGGRESSRADGDWGRRGGGGDRYGSGDSYGGGRDGYGGSSGDGAGDVHLARILLDLKRVCVLYIVCCVCTCILFSSRRWCMEARW